ncbi:MAG: molybdate ABC transporter permease subunit [Chloroflexota bacterium]|nr:molybdate ABC transporter permease subunit [Chloroflexota bacterium]
MFDIDLFPLRLSLQVAGLATAICLVVGVALARLLARRRFWGRDILSALVTLPLILPPTVLGYYLLQVLGRRTAVGAFLEDVFGIQIAFAWEGAVLASTIVALPLMVRSAQAAFESVDPSLENAARTLGRSDLGVFFTITLPLAWQGVAAGTALTFARAIGEFGATIMLAGNIPGKTQTMSVAIYDAWQSGDAALANALVGILTVTSVLSLLVIGRLVRVPRW